MHWLSAVAAACLDDVVTIEEMSALAERIADIKTNFEAFALSKIVEGRAGNCRA